LCFEAEIFRSSGVHVIGRRFAAERRLEFSFMFCYFLKEAFRVLKQLTQKHEKLFSKQLINQCTKNCFGWNS